MTQTPLLKIGRISYANTEPFFYQWDAPEFEYEYGSPAGLAALAKSGGLIAGPLPIVECWELEKDFEPLGKWCIAARDKCRSVFVLSKQPFSELDHVTIGATKDSATSVRLCETMVRARYGNDVRIRKGLQMEDVAWVVIGDHAMQLVASPTMREWPYITDLATEWWNWKHLPFVFARWVVRRDAPAAVKEKLDKMIAASVKKSMASVPVFAKQIAEGLKLPIESLITYYGGMVYEMDSEAEKSIAEFRKLVLKGASHGG